MRTHSIRHRTACVGLVTTCVPVWMLAIAITGCTEGGIADLDALCDDETCTSPGIDDSTPSGESTGPSSDDDDGAVTDDGDSGGAPASAGLPCAVLDVLRSDCHECHSAAPSFGAPMPLVDYDDLQVPALSDPTRTVAEMIAARVLDEANPMPPGGAMATEDRDALLSWIDAGAPADHTAECGEPDPDDEDPSGPDALPCEPDFVLTAHASGSEQPFSVPAVGADNLYMCFAFKAPFTEKTHATAWAPIIDDERVVHHWILYRTKAPQLEGGAVPCDVSLQLTAQFVAGWAPGGGNAVMPDDVGLDLGGPDDWYLLQVHYNNVAHYEDAVDQSGVAFCKAEEPRPKTAGILSLGSLAISIPPGAEDYPITGTCQPWTTAFWPEMHLLSASPHMHKLGRSMRSEIHRTDGSTEMLLDVPNFDFNSQGTHDFEPEVVIKPGDSITTTCGYDNPSAWPVLFGEGTDDEMCFDFVLAYPVDTLADRNCGVVL